MQTPLELTFRHMEPSDEVRELVEERVARLEHFSDRITSCHVYVQAPHQRHQQGNLYEVSIEVRIPGKELVVHQSQGDEGAHEHVFVAIRDAFTAMERKIRRWKRETGDKVKSREGPLQGRIVEINREEGYGQIAATDHRLVYFHRNAVVDGTFEALQPRDTVELVVQPDESEIGPQASTVRPIGPLKYVPR